MQISTLKTPRQVLPFQVKTWQNTLGWVGVKGSGLQEAHSPPCQAASSRG